MKSIRTKRIYEEAYDQDGYRILVDRFGQEAFQSKKQNWMIG
jgi:uncharacterized protein YeaO (DUF488 family)